MSLTAGTTQQSDPAVVSSAGAHTVPSHEGVQLRSVRARSVRSDGNGWR